MTTADGRPLIVPRGCSSQHRVDEEHMARVREAKRMALQFEEPECSEVEVSTAEEAESDAV